MNVLRLHDKKDNWLLYAFLLLFITAIICFLLLLDDNAIDNNSRSRYELSLSYLLLYGIVIAPIIEELSFRGVYLFRRKFTIIALVLLLVTVISAYKNFIVMGLFVLFLISGYYHIKLKSMQWLRLSYVINAMLFGFMHYEMSDFYAFETAFLVLFQFSLGLLFIWITINFGLKRSMLAHAGYNFIALGYLVLTLQFPDTKPDQYDDAYITVTWQRQPYFESQASTYGFLDYDVEARNTTIINLYKWYDVQELDNDKTAGIIPTEPYMKYDFNISLKDSTRKDLKKHIHNFLVKEELIVVQDAVD